MAGRRFQSSRDPARRRRILDAAKRHFSAHGFKGTALDAVAVEAGCSKGGLYLEFTDKEELLREVVSETFTAIRARFEREVHVIESPLERLVATLRFAYRQLAVEPMFTKLMRDDPDLRALFPAGSEEDVARAAKAQVDELLAWVDEGIARGEIRADVDREAIPTVIGVLRFAPQHVGLASSLGVFPADRTLEAIIDVFRAGLSGRSPHGERPPPATKKPTEKKRRSR